MPSTWQITCWGRVLGFLGGGIKGKEENTKFAANREHKKGKKYLTNSETTTTSLLCALPKSVYLFTRQTDKSASLKWIIRTPILGWNLLERLPLEPLGSGPVARLCPPSGAGCCTSKLKSPSCPWAFTGLNNKCTTSQRFCQLIGIFISKQHDCVFPKEVWKACF